MANPLENATWYNRKLNTTPMKTVAGRIPAVVVDAIASEVESRGVTISNIVAQALYEFRPDLPWLEESDEKEKS